MISILKKKRVNFCTKRLTQKDEIFISAFLHFLINRHFHAILKVSIYFPDDNIILTMKKLINQNPK